MNIEDHGVIGDLQTVALVARDGTIDWCCLPHFDSPSVFAAILDEERGGAFELRARGAVGTKQMYLPDSNVLVTRTYAENGVGQIQDFMPIAHRGERGMHQIVRHVSCVRGEVIYDLRCRPAFDYARAPHRVELVEGGAVFETPGPMTFALASPVPLVRSSGAVEATLRLREGEEASLSFCGASGAGGREVLALARTGDPRAQLERTIDYWQRWVSRCTYRGRWSEMVYRSALVLKLLTFEPTGAIVASPTTSLPETIGGSRNWDYRYTWLRDASFTLYALMRIGFTEETERFMDWLVARCREADFEAESPLGVMYGIRGEREVPERTLDHLRGYRDSRPVRIGNAAFGQLQLDIYGEVMDAIYLYNKYATPVSYELWTDVRRLMDWVADHWDQPDEGIWETRGGRRSFVYSRLMCWVALDRASRMCLKHSLPGNREKWMAERDRIYDQIMTLGWNEKRRAFRLAYDSDALDAANLIMPLVKFISPRDPGCFPRSTRRLPASRPTASSTATIRSSPPTGCREGKGPSACARSGWSKP
jgi:GH15 family glucan-1,4-alpha-glucosidase